MSQYIKMFPNASSPFIDVEPDPTFSDLVPEAYFHALIYVPSTIQPDMDASSGPTMLDGDRWIFGIIKLGAGNYRYTVSGVTFAAGTPSVMFDQWVEVEVHVVAGSHVFSVRINGTLYGPFTASTFWTPTGANYMGIDSFPNNFVGTGGGVNADDWIGFDELGWSTTGWISQGTTPDALWAFEQADPIASAITDYPGVPFYASSDAASFVLTSGGGSQNDIFPGGGGGGTPHTQAIDLSFISYRAFNTGDTDNDQSILYLAASSTIPIDLSAVKYRAKEFGDAEGNSD
jgi:hypothetical protein